jgi:site-specific recombinase XerD
MKIANEFSILFYLNKVKSNVKGTAPIYCRITILQKRAQFSTGKTVHTDKWNAKTGLIQGNSLEIKTINTELEEIKSDLRKTYNRLISVNENVTSELVLKTYLGRTDEKKSLMQLMDIYINILKQKSLAANPLIKPSRVAKFERIKKKLQKFFKSEYRCSDKILNDLKAGFGDDLFFYLTVKDKLSSNSAMKVIKDARQVLKFAVSKEWLPSNPLQSFKCTYSDPIRQRLTMDEVNTLYNKEITLKRLAEVRDVYVFSCYTGFAYLETYDLTAEDIILGIDGEKWLTKQRQKTDNPEMVPLLPIALEIIDRYKTHPYCIANNKLLPVDSNQRYNGYMKEIADICGIKKHLTTHTARHTFATTITLENDVPLETVSQMLGHKSVRTTQIYAKITQKKISNNMRELKSKLHPVIPVKEIMFPQ